MLEVQNLTKHYDGEIGIADVSFAVRSGEIVGLLGPNGAGKTTTINIILGVLEKDSGTLSILGRDPRIEREKVLTQMNFAAVYAQLPGNLTVWQNLYIFGLLYQVEKLTERITQLMKTFGLSGLRDTTTGVLSSGEQTRVNLTKALLNSPKLLLLDEPTASLDPHIAHDVRATIKAYVVESGAGVLWTSHNMHEVEAICDRVLFLSHGRILLEGDPKKLPQERGKQNLEELFISVAKEPPTIFA